jgi:hypothetical protein
VAESDTDFQEIIGGHAAALDRFAKGFFLGECEASAALTTMARASLAARVADLRGKRFDDVREQVLRAFWEQFLRWTKDHFGEYDSRMASVIASPEESDETKRLACLVAEQRAALVLNRDRLTYESMAIVLDVKLGTVKSRVARAKRSIGIPARAIKKARALVAATA